MARNPGDARPLRRAGFITSREMPPWHVDRTVGLQQFKDDPSLPDEEIQTIVRWVDAGAPQGNPADMPPPIEWAAADQFSFKPDLIVNLKKEVMPGVRLRPVDEHQPSGTRVPGRVARCRHQVDPL
jgi:hypothetical protein